MSYFTSALSVPFGDFNHVATAPFNAFQLDSDDGVYSVGSVADCVRIAQVRAASYVAKAALGAEAAFFEADGRTGFVELSVKDSDGDPVCLGRLLVVPDKITPGLRVVPTTSRPRVPGKCPKCGSASTTLTSRVVDSVTMSAEIVCKSCHNKVSVKCETPVSINPGALEKALYVLEGDCLGIWNRNKEDDAIVEEDY